MDTLKILILDNDPETVEFLSERFRRDNDLIDSCVDPKQLPYTLQKGFPDVIVLSPTWAQEGLAILDLLKKECEDLPVILVSENGGVPDAVEAMKKGARDYILKPLRKSGLDKAILHSAKEHQLLRRVNKLQEIYERRGQYDEMIGISYPMQRIYRTIETIARGDATILITGESGVGKELVAKAIHRRSARRDNPFIAINCASIPKDLLESELFGHEKGSFTSADRRHIGRCEEAHHGTLVLDEICEMGFDLQAKLLRFLQEKNFRRLGSDRLIEVDTRVICATNRNPQEEVEKGKLREDLYYRISVIPIEIPPLRDRKEDIPILAMKFLEGFSGKYDKYFYDFSAEAMQKLVEYPWPGNVRELKNTIEQIVVFNIGSQVIDRFLPERLRKNASARQLKPEAGGSDQEENARKVIRVHELEKQAILQALKVCQGNIGEAARRLGLGQATLYRKLKKYGLRG